MAKDWDVLSLLVQGAAIALASSVGPMAGGGDGDSDEAKAKAARRLQTRDYAAREALTTERSYVRDLRVMVEVLLEPMRAAAVKPGWPEEVADPLVLFSNVETLLGVNIEVRSSSCCDTIAVISISNRIVVSCSASWRSVWPASIR
jgi:hypothetical protein